MRAAADRHLAAAYARLVPSITRVIVAGMALLTASGAVWIVQGRPWTPALFVKIGLAAGVWILGPIIDKVVEPAFLRTLGATATAPSPECVRARRRYVTLEFMATGLLGATTVLGCLL